MFLSLAFTLWSLPIAFSAVWYKLQVSDMKEPRLFLGDIVTMSQAWCHPWEGAAAIPPCAASCHLPDQQLKELQDVFDYEWRISDPAAASGAWNSQGGEDLHSVLSPGAPLHCSSQNELRPSLTVSVFSLIIFLAAILVQCFLTQLMEVHRTKVPTRQGGFRDSCSLDIQPRPGCDRVNSFPQQGGVGRWGRIRAFCVLNKAAAHQLPQISGDRHWCVKPWQSCSPKPGEAQSPLTGTAVLNVRIWVSISQSPKPWVCPFRTSKPSPVLQRLLTPQSFIKEIKRNFPRLNQKQIYRIKDCRIKNSGWKGGTLKYSMYSKEI